MSNERFLSPFQAKLYQIIFETDTPAGKRFDVWLLVMILASVITVFLESIPTLNQQYLSIFKGLEWVFTVFFTIEYLLRIYCSIRPITYVRSFYGVIDLLSILPTYLSLLIPGSQVGAVIRVLRLLRVFRVFKLHNFLNQGDLISTALLRSRRKIAVFLYAVFLMVIVIGSFMYLIESNGPAADKFDSIPRSIYWAIVTITTVGYGDISPATTLGQFVAALVMVAGYAIIAVPTGIVSAELMTVNRQNNANAEVKVCLNCQEEGHDADAKHCKMCGGLL
ncbi:ion transporter [bacterium]|nr:ion transporter [bacterium]